MTVVLVGSLLLLLGATLGVRAWLARPGAVLYVGGAILTMDAGNRVVEALAVAGERIHAAGPEAELRDWAEREGARAVDLRGRALLPGFIDAHGHFPGEGMRSVFVDLNSPPIGDVSGIDGLVTRLAGRAQETAVGAWVVGVGYDDSLLAERRHPTRLDLDRASMEHPIAVLHISGHLAVANSAGLAELGIDRDTPDPEGGVIRRDPDTGQPDGVLEETAMAPVQQKLVPSARQGFAMLRAAGRSYLATGVTTAQSGLTPPGLMRTFDWMAWLGFIPVRLVMWPDESAAEKILGGGYEAPRWDPLRVRGGAVKLIADGSIQGYTGYLGEPYFVPPGGDPSYRGYPRIPRDALISKVERYHAFGMQLAIHGNGDAAIDDILDAFENAQRKHPRDDARHIIIHAQMAREDQLDRMKALGVLPSFFSLHTFYWGDRHREVFMGPDRAARMSPAKSALDRELRFTIHCDSPVVPVEPLRLVWSAVNRRTRSGFVVGEDQRIPVMAALRAVTIDAAWQHFEEADKGSLEPGKLADLVILSRNPLDDPANLHRIEVEQTLIGGRTVFRNGP